jgi:hypothetical protein
MNAKLAGRFGPLACIDTDRRAAHDTNPIGQP